MLSLAATPSTALAATEIFTTGTDADTNGEDDVWDVQEVGADLVPYDALVTENNRIPNVWSKNDADSSWITSVDPGTRDTANSTFLFSAELLLTDVGPNQLWEGIIWADNSIKVITVNGADIFTGNIGSYTGEAFSFSSADLGQFLVEGVNTFSISVRNTNPEPTNPVGFRLNSTVNAVPEPATWLLMILGLGAVGATIRRSNAKVRFKFA